MCKVYQRFLRSPSYIAEMGNWKLKLQLKKVTFPSSPVIQITGIPPQAISHSSFYCSHQHGPLSFSFPRRLLFVSIPSCFSTDSETRSSHCSPTQSPPVVCIKIIPHLCSSSSVAQPLSFSLSLGSL